MDDTTAPDNHPGILAGHLAKLNHRLRHLHVEGELTGPLAAPGLAYGVVARLQVAARLLAHPAAAGTGGDPSLQRLGLVLGEFLTGLGQPPRILPAYLMPPLEQLSAFLAEVFDRLDAGQEPSTICADVGWSSLVASFVDAGRPWQCLDEMERGLRAWSAEHPRTELSPADQDELRRRWHRLRNCGDTLFGAGESQNREQHRRVVLLLDSSFRQNQLCERLHDAGWTVEAATDPQDVMRRLAAPAPPELVFCDNLEPSSHLNNMRCRLADLTPSARPGLVLVAAATGSETSRQERARHLGAQVAWAEPFRLADLVEGLS